MTPAMRLQISLSDLSPNGLRAVARTAGVNERCAQRAFGGIPVNAVSYIRLCAVCGIDVATGDHVEARIAADLDWRLLGLGLNLTRRLRKELNIRQAAKKIGKAVSVSMLSRVENGHPISISGVIAICKFIGTRPEQYCAEPEKLHVRPKTATDQPQQRRTLCA